MAHGRQGLDRESSYRAAARRRCAAAWPPAEPGGSLPASDSGRASRPRRPQAHTRGAGPQSACAGPVAWRHAGRVGAGARLGGPQRGRATQQTAALLVSARESPSPRGRAAETKPRGLALRLALPHQGVAVALAGAKGPQGADLGGMLWGDVGPSTGIVMHLHADGERARRVPGCPPRLWQACGHQDAVVFQSATPQGDRGQPTHRKSLCLALFSDSINP